MTTQQLKHFTVHLLLIIGSFFMLFPFVWMFFSSFKSKAELTAPSDTINVLPDSMRPEIFNDDDAKARLEQQANDEKAWNEAKAAAEKKQAELAKAGKHVSIDSLMKEAQEKDRKLRKPFELWDNYKEALKQQPFGQYFLNTIFVSITVTAVSLFFASLAAFSFAFFKFPYQNALFMLLLGTMMLPQQALLIPNYIVLSKIGWVNTYLALTVPWFASAYAVFFLRQFFMQLPKDLFEAATIDGCTRFQFYWMVALPLCKSPLVTLGIFTFLSNWNAFIWPLIVTNDENLRVLQVGLSYFQSDAGNDWGPLMAASTMTVLPLMIMYFFAQKQFVESQMSSGMKE